jgi:hypothetical protein
MSDNVVSLAEYKRAKIFTNDLEKIIKIISLSIQGLSHFSRYTPVNTIISTLQTNKTLLEIHYNKYKKIVENKTTPSNGE